MYIQGKESRTEFPLIVAIEIDPERASVHPTGRPAMLGKGDADQMLAHLAADLGTVLGGIGNCQLAAAGAVFDQCQVWRPGLPVFTALSQLLTDVGTDRTTPSLLAVAPDDGQMPVDTLSPDTGIPPAALLLLPMLAAGAKELLQDLTDSMEHRFLAEGQVSAHTASWLEAAFGIGIKHARFMTLTDLNAMFRMQLEHFGYLPLWELVDAAVSNTSRTLSLKTDNGTRFDWRDNGVRVEFQTFDHWANHGSGREVGAGVNELCQGYAEWSRELRRYTSTLAAHRVPVQFELPTDCEGYVSEHFLCEEVALPETSEPHASITEHSWPELGIVAVTARTADSLQHFYPLTPRGLNDIHAAVQALQPIGEGIAFPGRIRHCASSRRLRPGIFDA